MLLSVSKYIFNSLHTTLLILAVYTLPFFILDYICNISGNMFSYILCTIIKNLLFTLPVIPVIYMIIGQKITKQISDLKPKTSNGTHIYQNLLLTFTYIALSILTNFNIYTSFVFNSISYSIYFSEMIYNFIDFDEYKYRNIIDFYNYNKKLFLSIGFLFGIISLNTSIQFMPLLYYLFTSSIAPLILLKYKFNEYNNLISHTNILKIFELPLNMVIFIVHTYLHNNVTIKNIKKH